MQPLQPAPEATVIAPVEDPMDQERTEPEPLQLANIPDHTPLDDPVGHPLLSLQSIGAPTTIAYPETQPLQLAASETTALAPSEEPVDQADTLLPPPTPFIGYSHSEGWTDPDEIEAALKWAEYMHQKGLADHGAEDGRAIDPARSMASPAPPEVQPAPLSPHPASVLLAANPDQIPVDGSVGPPPLSPEAQAAGEFPTAEQSPARGAIPGSSQDTDGSAGGMADEALCCYACGSPDHWARTCPSLPNAAAWSSSDSWSPDPWAQTVPSPEPPSNEADAYGNRCYLCGSEDHWKWACARNPTPPPADVCLTCARLGHGSRDCMTPVGWRPAPGLCYECGRTGHAAYRCPVLSLDSGDSAMCYVHARLRGRNNLFREGNSLPRCKHDMSCDLLPPIP